MGGDGRESRAVQSERGGREAVLKLRTYVHAYCKHGSGAMEHFQSKISVKQASVRCTNWNNLLEQSQSSTYVCSEDATAGMNLCSEDATAGMNLCSEDATAGMNLCSEDATAGMNLCSEDATAGMNLCSEDATAGMNLCSEDATAVRTPLQ